MLDDIFVDIDYGQIIVANLGISNNSVEETALIYGCFTLGAKAIRGNAECGAYLFRRFLLITDN